MSSVRPYHKNKLNYTEIFNEGVITVVACLFFVLTDLVDNVETKSLTGWVIILVILFNIFVNLVVLIAEMVITVVRKFKEWRLKKRQMKYGISEKGGADLHTGMNLFSKGDTYNGDATQSKLN
jgi:hypothetical protein